MNGFKLLREITHEEAQELPVGTLFCMHVNDSTQKFALRVEKTGSYRIIEKQYIGVSQKIDGRAVRRLEDMRKDCILYLAGVETPEVKEARLETYPDITAFLADTQSEKFFRSKHGSVYKVNKDNTVASVISSGGAVEPIEIGYKMTGKASSYTALWKIIPKPKTDKEKETEFFFGKPVEKYVAPAKAEAPKKYHCQCGAEIDKDSQVRCGECELTITRNGKLNSVREAINHAMVFGINIDELKDTVHEELKRWTRRK